MAHYHTFKRHRRPKSAERLLLERLVREVERIKRKLDNIMPVLADLQAIATRTVVNTDALIALAGEPNPADPQVQAVIDQLSASAVRAEEAITRLSTPTVPPVEEPPVEQPPL